jgi:undecaprenyl-diphosphatase
MAGRQFGGVDVSVLVAGLIVVAGVFGVIELMQLASAATPPSFDTRILLAFREAGHPDTPLGPHWLKEAVRDGTSLGSATVVFLLAAVVAIHLALSRSTSTGLFVVFAVAGGQALVSLLKLLVDRPRPEIVSHLTQVSTLSFPSGHATMSAVTYLTLGLLAARFLPRRATKIYVVALAVVLTFLIGVSRLYLGVHWPSDVMAGWCAGFAWASLCWLAARFTGIGRS